jgi:hypothetical protein
MNIMFPQSRLITAALPLLAASQSGPQTQVAPRAELAAHLQKAQSYLQQKRLLLRA